MEATFANASTASSANSRTIILLASHLLAKAQALADRVTTLGQGKAGQPGTPAPDAVSAVTWTGPVPAGYCAVAWWPAASRRGRCAGPCHQRTGWPRRG
jgi:hypothetical protein